jgi:hypothetical protein
MATALCRGCAVEITTPQDAHEIVAGGRPYGPLCFSCAQSAKGIPFAQWLDEQWQRQVFATAANTSGQVH